MLNSIEDIDMHKLQPTVFAFIILFLTSCSDSKPDGHAYTVNGLGQTLPTPNLEIAFLPYPSRADFFHEPISEAYKFATSGLDESLAPLCDDALALVNDEESFNERARKSLLQEGNVPKTPDACMNMCLSRVDLEGQREVDRKDLNKKIAEIDASIKSANQKKSELLASRSEKLGALTQQLTDLKKKRSQLLAGEATKLAKKQIAGLTIEVGARRLRWEYSDAAKRVTVDLRNNSQFAIKGSPSLDLEGYYKGIKIGDYSVTLSAPNKTDSLGFDKKYSLGVGEIGRLEDSIYYSVEGLSLNSPSGRLIAQERGWQSNREGYVLPDEIRIISFPETAFVIPDHKGKRQGSSIVYSPEPVNFKEQVAARGLPQDNEIAKISKQISDQSFPEDSQIASLDNEIAGFRAEQKSLRSAFNSSDTAKNIDSLDRAELLCRAASAAMNEIDKRTNVINHWKTNLSSCGTEEMDSGVIFSAIQWINSDLGNSIVLPNIDKKYAAKARQLIFKKLASEVQAFTRTDINGAFTIDGSVDQSNFMLFAPTITPSGERFWMQPLGSMGDNKNLDHSLISDHKFEHYVNDVISYSCKDCSIEEFANMMDEMGHSAPHPNRVLNRLSMMEIHYTSKLAEITSDEPDASVLVSSQVDRVCKM